MGKTFKDQPKYRPKDQPSKPKEGRRFEPTKGRKPKGNLKDLIRNGRNLEDYFI